MHCYVHQDWATPGPQRPNLSPGLKLAGEQFLISDFYSSPLGCTGCISGRSLNLIEASIHPWVYYSHAQTLFAPTPVYTQLCLHPSLFTSSCVCTHLFTPALFTFNSATTSVYAQFVYNHFCLHPAVFTPIHLH